MLSCQQPFSNRPPPNRTCGFHRIRLSSRSLTVWGRFGPSLLVDGQDRVGVLHYATSTTSHPTYLHPFALASCRVGGFPARGLLRVFRLPGALAR